MSTALKEYYESLSPEKRSARRVFIDSLMEELGKDRATIYRYINSETEPDLSGKKIIAIMAYAESRK